jgi:phage terminase Nu1 subunit (DNA packaging protein)
MIDINAVQQQKHFAELTSLTSGMVPDLLQRGIITDSQTLKEQVRSYCRYIREIAAGRAGTGPLSLADERAALAKSQRERIDMQNAITRREYGPVSQIEYSVADTMAQAANMLDAIPGKLRLANDKLTSEDLNIVASVIALVRNDVANLEIDWLDEKGGDASVDATLES